MKSNRLVYTVIFGDYDVLEEVKHISPGVDYYCITDNKEIRSDTWKVIYLDNVVYPSDKNRELKFFPFKTFDYVESIYIDGNISITGDVNYIFDHYLKKSDIAVSRHPLRNCLYEEGQVCIKAKKANISDVENQLNAYRKAGFPHKYGLFENNVIVRRHSVNIKKLMSDWWEEYCSYTKRDQLSFCYVLWKNSISCTNLGVGPRYTNKYFCFRLHKHERKLPIYKKLILISGIRQRQNKLYFIVNCIVKKLLEVKVSR